MNKHRSSFLSVGVFVCLAALLGGTAWQYAQQVRAQEEPETEEREEFADAERLERRLDEIEELIEQAEQAGEEDTIRELREKGEQILDRLEQIERSREEPEEEFEGRFEGKLRELEVHRLELEIERMHQELQAVELQRAAQMGEMNRSPYLSAAYAINQAVGRLEHEDARHFLEDLLEESEDAIVQRLIRHRLVQLQFDMDDHDAALETARKLILE